MTYRRMLDRSFVAAGVVQESKKSETAGKGSSSDISIRRKLAQWASYNEKIERACAASGQR